MMTPEDFIRRQRTIGDAQAAFVFDLARGVPRQGTLRWRLVERYAARDLNRYVDEALAAALLTPRVVYTNVRIRLFDANDKEL